MAGYPRPRSRKAFLGGQVKHTRQEAVEHSARVNYSNFQEMAAGVVFVCSADKRIYARIEIEQEADTVSGLESSRQFHLATLPRESTAKEA